MPTVVHRLRSALPELANDEVLYTLLSKHQLTAIALVQFLRGPSSPTGWHPAPLRAAFLFDDPNLRWRSYGFIDYRSLLAHADEHGYHASMAMIPLDAGRPHPATAAMFRRRADRLSLIVHGNDHTKASCRQATRSTKRCRSPPRRYDASSASSGGTACASTESWLRRTDCARQR